MVLLGAVRDLLVVAIEFGTPGFVIFFACLFREQRVHCPGVSPGGPGRGESSRSDKACFPGHFPTDISKLFEGRLKLLDAVRDHLVDAIEVGTSGLVIFFP